MDLIRNGIGLEIMIKTDKILDSNLNELVREWFVNDFDQIKSFIKKAIENYGNIIIDDLPEILQNNIKNINLCCDPKFSIDPESINGQCEIIDKRIFCLGSCRFTMHFYRLYDDVFRNTSEEDSPCTFHAYLPSPEYVGLWESLMFDSDVKENLLNYVRASIMFGKRKVNSSLVNWNKLILLHGPPGTGKTSLCKALCQKLSIILDSEYQNFQLIEINAHSLFSKWFAESGKLVLKLFNSIKELAQDDSELIFVLIDEVESLVYDRQRANSSDPSDAIRVVNALLTQLDSIKQYPNIIVLANSNITDAMDNAFIDRADIKRFIGYPSFNTIYNIYISTINELIGSSLIVAEKDYPFPVKPIENISNSSNYSKLCDVASKSHNLSGRTLRKLPFITLALHCDFANPLPLNRFLDLLEITVEAHKKETDCLNKTN